MSVWQAAWLGLAGGVLALWLLRYALVSSVFRRREVLTAASPAGLPDPPPTISVVVPARNEERNIEDCVHSLLRQDYPNLQVIVVDDRSTDATGAQLQGLRAAHGTKLSIETVDALPDGWCGKTHAMWQGARATHGDWVLFTDADCRLPAVNAVRVAMAEAVRSEVHLFTLASVLDVRHAWERICYPVFAASLLVWFLPTRVNNPACRTAFGNGQFLLLRRETALQALVDARVRSSVNEDVQIARVVKGSGRSIRVMENDGLLSVRMYESFSDALRGWGRIFCAVGSVGRLGATLLMLLVFAVLPLVSTVAAWAGFAAAGPEARAAWFLLALGWTAVMAVQPLASARLYAMMHIGRAWAVTYALGAVVATGVACRALLALVGLAPTRWRGRSYWHGRSGRAEMPMGVAAAKEPSADA